MNKMFNWTFGAFFRSLGRYLFYVFLGLIFYFISTRYDLSHIFPFLKVNASTIVYNTDYSYSKNPQFLFSSVQGISQSKNDSCINGLDVDLSDNLILYDSNFTDDTSSLGILYSHGTNATIFNVKNIYLDDTSSLKKFYHLTFGLYNPNSYIIQGGTSSVTKYFAFLVATDKVKLFDSTFFSVSSTRFILRNNGNWTYQSMNNPYNVNYYSNGGNLTWIVFSTKFGNWGFRGIGFDLFVNPSVPILCSNSKTITYGIEWLQVLDYKYFYGSNFNESELSFSNIKVDSNNYYCPVNYDCTSTNNTGSSDYVPDINIDTDLFNSDFILFYNFSDISSLNIFVDYDFSTFTDFEKLILTICFNILYLIFVIVVVYILLKALNKLITWVFR